MSSILLYFSIFATPSAYQRQLTSQGSEGKKYSHLISVLFEVPGMKRREKFSLITLLSRTREFSVAFVNIRDVMRPQSRLPT